MRIEWDQAKNEINQARHGIDFETAQLVFDDPCCVTFVERVTDGSRATIQSLSGESGGGKVTVSGFAGYGGDALVFRLQATAHELRVRYPEDFSTVANASLSLTGTSDSSRSE